MYREYRFPVPVKLEEFKLAQRYCIAKRSEQETTGDEGVETVKDEPFEHEIYGKGRYTEKIIYLGKHIPTWARKIVPNKAVMIIEKSWNAFPYCKSVYSSPFFDKFSMSIVSMHAPDSGTQENILGLPADVLKQRQVEIIDIACDPIDPAVYKKEEDPALWHSEKKDIGPLEKGWMEKSDPIMCSYKLVTVEFRYFGFRRKTARLLDG